MSTSNEQQKSFNVDWLLHREYPELPYQLDAVLLGEMRECRVYFFPAGEKVAQLLHDTHLSEETKKAKQRYNATEALREIGWFDLPENPRWDDETEDAQVERQFVKIIDAPRGAISWPAVVKRTGNPMAHLNRAPWRGKKGKAT